VLTSIDVGHNQLDEEAALSIVRAVRPRDQMTSLGLASCKISPTGAAEIAEYVRGSAVLTVLDLQHNDLKAAAETALKAAAKGRAAPLALQV